MVIRLVFSKLGNKRTASTEPGPCRCRYSCASWANFRLFTGKSIHTNQIRREWGWGVPCTWRWFSYMYNVFPSKQLSPMKGHLHSEVVLTISHLRSSRELPFNPPGIFHIADVVQFFESFFIAAVACTINGQNKSITNYMYFKQNFTLIPCSTPNLTIPLQLLLR